MFNLFKRKKETLPFKEGDVGCVKKFDKNKEGYHETYIGGTKYPIKGTTRKWVLQEVLDPIKRKIVNEIKDWAWKSIASKLPDNELCPAVKEIARVMDLVIKAEQTEGQKQKMTDLKNFICSFLEEDTAYRYRVQWFLQHLNMKKVKLDKGDLYYFRAKLFDADD